MNTIETLLGRIAAALGAVACACLVFLMLMTFADVVGRYFLNEPITFTVEITELMMGLVIMLSLGLVTLNNGHISVDIVTRSLRPSLRAATDLIGRLCTVGFLIVITWQLYEQFLLVLGDGLFTQVVGAPVYPFVFVMAVAAAFTSLIAAWRLFVRGKGPAA